MIVLLMPREINEIMRAGRGPNEELRARMAGRIDGEELEVAHAEHVAISLAVTNWRDGCEKQMKALLSACDRHNF